MVLALICACETLVKTVLSMRECSSSIPSTTAAPVSSDPSGSLESRSSITSPSSVSLSISTAPSPVSLLVWLVVKSTVPSSTLPSQLECGGDDGVDDEEEVEHDEEEEV